MIALSSIHALHCACALYRSRSPDKRHPSAYVVDIPALRLLHIMPREKMHIGHDPAHMTVDEPLGADLGRRGHVARVASSRQFQISRRAVHSILRRVPPDRVAPDGHEDVDSEKQLQGGMDVDDVTRTDEARVVEIARLKIEWIKGPQGAAAV